MTIEAQPLEGPAERAQGMGLLALAVGFAAFTLLTTLFFMLASAMIFAIDAGLNGFDHPFATLDAAKAKLEGGGMQELLVPALAVSGLFYAAAIAAMFAGAWIYRRKLWRGPIGWLPFSGNTRYWICVAAGLVYGVAAGFVIQYFYPEAKNWFHLPPGALGLFVTFVLAVILAPLAEELFFRGWLFTAIRPWAGFAPTLIVTSACFALAHWERTHLYAAAVFPVGLLLGYVRERSGSVRATILMHALYNANALLTKYFFPDL